MADNDAFATAAHLHVLLRRKTGRVTDTEWMATNAEYAAAIVAYARQQASSDGHAELLPWAERLEALIPVMGAPVRKPLFDLAAERLRKAAAPAPATARPGFSDSVPASGFRDSAVSGFGGSGTAVRETPETRYVGRLR